MHIQAFDLGQDEAYQRWRDHKLANRAVMASDLMVSVDDLSHLTPEEHLSIKQVCHRNNMAIIQNRGAMQANKAMVPALGQQMGLNRLDTNLRADEDSITSLRVREQSGNQYIPYTNKPLSWHTDGYYNACDQQIRGIIMFCASPAASGGENALIDHELLYIRLRDENPEYIKALMQSEVMTIPPNLESGVEIRPAQTGPVFSIDASTGHLHMRYSARQKNIEWQTDGLTQQAVSRITQLLEDDELVIKYKFESGEGIICNNVLHNRTRFEDTETQKRLIYRARYYDRVDDYDE